MKSAASNTIPAQSYSARELMVAAAAREIHDSEIVFVGMRLPILAFAVAKRTHAPRAIGLFENGVIRETPSRELLYTMADPPNLRGATLAGTMLDVMGFLEQGRVNVGFLGTAEVDRFGNLNTTLIRGEGRFTRLPGSGGACDIACMAQRTVVLLEHSKRRLVPRVSYITSPGNGDGNVAGKINWRVAQGLPSRSGPSAIITTLGVIRFAADNGEAFLASVHPGVQVEDVLSNTGWPLRVSENLTETALPTVDELAAMRDLDPEHFWTSD
jgi:glutaconate CoA-transferase subunit B